MISTRAASAISPSPQETTVAIACDGDILTARREGRSYVLQLGFSSPDATLVATAISELARNIVLYAEHGEIVLKPLDHDGRAGVLIIARDQGPGIPEGHQVASGTRGECGPACRGLRGLRRLVDECEIVSQAGRGTVVALKKWRQPG
ncbi:MAG: ATP-binding protein [Burkholderiales bacterium]